ncbi:MAG: prepilin-type N-terminal cleavage/methylation domain-containing protein [Candidatus Omnitrophica bacterium]|nr:hypothetical protein [bacterium]NUN94942.1 prepilin-type N-terminal cleavage/methylation domain-containing protein [Candidatus Omnitrophota bacterium]
MNLRPVHLTRGRGFTLIELLIVIAIILILIAIALPNFLEAQVRARAAKAKGELRSLGIAMEAYNLDFRDYPPESEDDCTSRPRTSAGHFWLTSPIRYIASIPEDPFPRRDSGSNLHFHCYESGGIERGGFGVRCPTCMVTWVIYSRGPSEAEPILRSADPHFDLGGGTTLITYSPTNGTRSLGTIHWWGGDGWWIGVPAGTAAAAARNTPPIAGPYGLGLPVDYVAYVHRLPPNLK